MNETILVELILIVLMTIMLFSIIITAVTISNALNKKTDLEIAKLEMSITPKKEDFDIIDLMIEEEVNKYHLIKNEPNGVQYMSDDSIVEMERYILEKVLNNISPINLQRLKYVYNPDKLEDIIYEKIQLAVISYSTELNTTNKES